MSPKAQYGVLKNSLYLSSLLFSLFPSFVTALNASSSSSSSGNETVVMDQHDYYKTSVVRGETAGAYWVDLDNYGEWKRGKRQKGGEEEDNRN